MKLVVLKLTKRPNEARCEGELLFPYSIPVVYVGGIVG